MNEFEAIERFFLPLTRTRDEALALSDDAAVLAVPEGYELVVSSDTVCEGRHFEKGASPEFIAQKALRSNLSDMAAMGARPYCYQLCLSFEAAPEEAWLSVFTGALLRDQEAFDVFCSGGDTSLSSGGLQITITMMGLVEAGKAVKRSGAKVGNLMVVTGIIGAARALNYQHIPTPRVAIADEIARYAYAAIDVSDGLVADIGHICKASGVCGILRLGDVPLPEERAGASVEELVTGGDDYEIVMAVASEDFAVLKEACAAKGVSLYVIGAFEKGEGLKVLDEGGQVIEFEHTGWSHF